MPYILAQFGDSSIFSLILLFVLIFLYPRLYIWQMILRLETQVRELEGYARAARSAVVRKAAGKKPSGQLRQAVERFMSFFVIEPVSLDPYGIIKKLEHVVDESERRIELFVNQIAPRFSAQEKANIRFGLIGAVGVTQIFKIIRHYLITIKKTNNLQLAMLLQMIMPVLTKLAKANLKATEAFVRGIPIGDAIGPLVAANLKTKIGKRIAKEVIVSNERVSGKRTIIMKAEGPGAALGKLGSAVESLARRRAIDHIITIDAAGKLEGERTGEVAEGVGVTMGGIGVEKSKIENVAVRYGMPLDGVAIKMAPEEAPVPMKKLIFRSAREAQRIVERLIKETKHRRILVIGVGNTCGIGNTKKDVKDLEERIKKIWVLQAIEEEEERRRGFGIFRGGQSQGMGMAAKIASAFSRLRLPSPPIRFF